MKERECQTGRERCKGRKEGGKAICGGLKIRKNIRKKNKEGRRHKKQTRNQDENKITERKILKKI